MIHGSQTKKLVISALCVALGLILPSLFHTIGWGGPVFLPMHIPVLICGLLCGSRFGALCGIIVPILSSVTTGMPPLYPVAFTMALELGTYGLIGGLLSKKFNVYISLIIAMFAGRVVAGIANTIFLGMAGKAYGFSAFIAASFITPWPGILIQLIFVPLIVTLLKKQLFTTSVISNC